MAAPKKQKRVVQQEENSSDSDDNMENDDDQQEMETIEVDFDVKVPEENDRIGIKNLLHQLFLKAHVSTSELADLLIEQNNVTGVIKEADSDDMDDDDDMDVDFGVFSIINLTAKQDKECVKQIRHYLLTHCKDSASNESYENFKKIMEDPEKHVGLIISERFLNIPAKIAIPLYSNLKQDMNEAVTKKQPYNFAYYLLISKTVTFNVGKENENTIFLNPEEELYAEEADFFFEFEVQTEQDSGLSGTWTDDDDEGLPKRKVLLLAASKWDTMYNKMTAELGTF